MVPTLHDRGDERFHDARTASTSPSLASPPNAILVPSSSRLQVMSMGLFDPRRFDGMRSLTPLSRLPLTLHAHELSPVLDSLIPRSAPYVFGNPGVGRKSEEAAETTVTNGS